MRKNELAKNSKESCQSQNNEIFTEFGHGLPCTEQKKNG